MNQHIFLWQLRIFAALFQGDRFQRTPVFSGKNPRIYPDLISADSGEVSSLSASKSLEIMVRLAPTWHPLARLLRGLGSGWLSLFGLTKPACSARPYSSQKIKLPLSPATVIKEAVGSKNKSTHDLQLNTNWQAFSIYKLRHIPFIIILCTMPLFTAHFLDAHDHRQKLRVRCRQTLRAQSLKSHKLILHMQSSLLGSLLNVRPVSHIIKR